MKVLVTLAGFMGILVCFGFIIFGLLARAYIVSAIWFCFMVVCSVLIKVARNVVDLMEKRRESKETKS